jgi:hypothetical protein
MLFLAELPLCLVFVQKCDFQEKSWKILQKSYFTKRHVEPEYEMERGQEGTTTPGGAGQSRPRQGVVWLPHPSPRASLPPIYTLWPKNIGGSAFFQIEFHCIATIKNRDSELETPFWHPAGTGIWQRSSPSSSPTSLHQPSMIPLAICE